MKKLLANMIVITIASILPSNRINAQDPVTNVIKEGIKKVIKAVDLKIQRLQNKTIWLQNAQKVAENAMSDLNLNDITTWVEKQRTLYKNYFEELWKVKTAISYYHRIKDITKKQVHLVQEYKSVWMSLKKDRHFTANELFYMADVYRGIMNESVKNLDQLLLVINPFSTQMSDAKRLEIINKAADLVETNYNDLKAFNQQNIMLGLQRSRTQNDVDVVKELNGF